MTLIKAAITKISSISPSILISLLALLVSFGQLLASVPLLSNFYSMPKLAIDGSTSRVSEPKSLASFTLTNSGRLPATNVEVGLDTRIGDRIFVIPAVSHKVVTDEEPVVFDHARVELARLLPGEVIMILVIGDGDEPLPKHMLDSYKESGIVLFPSVSYLRSDQGSGVIHQLASPEVKQSSGADSKK